MSITLRISSDRHSIPAELAQNQFDLEMFSVGRSPTCHCSLPDSDRHVSSTHCWFEFRNGNWIVTDTSTNGVFINDSEERIPKYSFAQIRHMDRLHVGDYLIEVDLLSMPPESDTDIHPSGNPFENEPGGESDQQEFPQQGEIAQSDSAQTGHDPDNEGARQTIDDIHGLREEEDQAVQMPEEPAQQESEHSPKYQTGMIKPVPDWDRDPDEEEPGDQAPEAKAPSQGGALASFAEGAGLDLGHLDAVDEDEFFRNLGLLLHNMTRGLKRAMASRSQIKSEMRADQTQIAASENNPFKFMASVDEILMHLVHRTNPGFLSGPEAAAEATSDINAHQIGVVAGTEAALKRFLQEFNPSTVEQKTGAGGMLDKVFPSRKDARHWNTYKLVFDKTSEAADEQFQKYFGAEFVKAYEERLRLLKRLKSESE